MAKSNYNYEKRQRELAKKKKKEEKRLKKLEKVDEETLTDDPLLADDQNTSI
ncbi:MAG: hypothetical protein HRT52_20615 [Colwellia sp.]|nr:hypothetical protein [Colwellia sp.]